VAGDSDTQTYKVARGNVSYKKHNFSK